MSHFSWQERPGLVLSSARRDRRRRPLSLEGLESRITPSDSSIDFPCIITPYPPATVKDNQAFSLYVQAQHSPFHKDVDVSKDYTGTMIVTTEAVTAANLATVHIYAQHTFSGGGTYAFALKLPGNGSTGLFVTDTTTFNSDGTGIYVTPAMKLGADAVSNSEVDLAWSAIKGATSYQIFENGGQIATVGSSSLTGLTPNAAPPTSYHVTGLTKDTAYDFEVKATAADGTHTSNDAEATTLPDPPVLTVTPELSNYFPEFSWTDMSAAAPDVKYRLTLTNAATNKIAYDKHDFPKSITKYTFPDLAPGAYTAVVTATIGGDDLRSKPVNVQIGIQASLVNGALTIEGTFAADKIFVGQSNGQISVKGQVTDQTAPQDVLILAQVLGDPEFVFNLGADKVTSIVVTGRDGDDQILLNQGDEPIQAAASIDGGLGTDFVAGVRGTGGPGTLTNCEFDANNPAPNGTRLEDIFQAGLGNCGLLSSLGEVAKRGIVDLKDRIHYTGNDGDIDHAFSFTVDLYKEGGQTTPVPVIFNGLVNNHDPQPYLDYGSAHPVVPAPNPPFQFWTVLYRRAYLKMTGLIDDGVFPMDALRALTGRESVDEDFSTIFSNTSVFDSIESEINMGGNVVAVTYPDKDGAPVSMKLISLHAYTVVSVSRDTSGNPDSILLRNPWGTDVGSVANKVSSGADPYDGLVTVAWVDFQKYINYVTLNGPAQSAAFTTPKIATLSAGAPDSFDVETSGNPAPTFSLDAKDKLPEGVTFNTATGALSGTAAPSAVGVYTLHITANNTIGKATTQTLTLSVSPFTVNQSPPTPTEGDRPVNVLVGTFTDANPAAVVSQYTATVKWGDGQTSNTAAKSVSIVADPNHAGVYDIMATKPGAYSKAGQNLPFSVTVSAPHVPSDTENAAVAVTDPPLTLTPTVPAITVGQAVTKALVGTFTDAFAGSHATDYTANVFWGDGQSSSSAAKNVTIAADPKQKGVFDIFATKPNPYSAQPGGVNLTVTVMDKGGAADSVTSPATVTTPAPGAKPLVLTATPNFAAITNARNGANGFSITVTYDQPMNPAVKPVITFSPSTAKTLKLASGSWDGAGKVYTAVYNVTVADVTLNAVQATISGAKSAANVAQTSFVRAGLFSINTTTNAVGPTVVSATPVIGTITNAQGGANGFGITVTYDQVMNRTVKPVITFSRDLGATLAPASGSWDVTGKIYTARYNVALANVTDNAVQVTIGGALNAAGVLQPSFTRSGLFAIGTTAGAVTTPTAPNVVSAMPSIGTITNAQGGANRFNIAVTYNQVMDTAFTPSITFSPNVSSTLTFASGSWNAGHTVYTAVYNVALATVTDNAVQVTVSGGKSASDVSQTAFSQNGVFSINTTVVSGGPNISVTENNSSANVTAGYFGESFVPTASGPMTQLNILNITGLDDAQVQSVSSVNATIKIFQGGINTTDPHSADYDTPAGSLLYSQNFTFSVGNNSIMLATPPSLTAGQTYLWEVTSDNLSAILVNFATNNPYPAGDTMAGPLFGYDLDFQVYV
ncbi:C2 family cysteine protease [Zavarzinella formosa]|uniref:C2 family cysteine protease n=1 Tax=Zavarzinella formosa TaxID=360055 RepID=UPI0002DBC2A8|nr:C2 family cysteine protease [Zavarzinella formosa]